MNKNIKKKNNIKFNRYIYVYINNINKKLNQNKKKQKIKKVNIIVIN